KEGELITFIGPSGCGKTTLLRTIAGFYKPTTGHVYLDGEDITNLPPEKRATGMVFQNYALFPHLSVFSYLSYRMTSRTDKRSGLLTYLLKNVRQAWCFKTMPSFHIYRFLKMLHMD